MHIHDADTIIQIYYRKPLTISEFIRHFKGGDIELESGNMNRVRGHGNHLKKT